VKIAVVDYGMGNLRSVSKALEQVAPGAAVSVSSSPGEVAAADRVVFPGQGAMPDCMRELEARGLRPAVVAASRSKPFLGICIGLQMLFERSEEGDTPGLGLFAGEVRRFASGLHGADGARLKVPHMGWNRVEQTREHALWRDISPGERFYFVHSYFAAPRDRAVVAGEADYGGDFCCAIARENIFAVHFHPEKSHTAGLKLLANFVHWNP
jgi:glutamine amidotransferase